MRAQRHLLIATIAALACGLLPAFGAGAQTVHDYVANGGFEDGLSGWVASPNSELSLEPDGVPAAEGASRARIVLGAGAFALSTGASNVAPGSYEVSARVWMSSPGIRAYVQLAPLAASERTREFDLPQVAGSWLTIQETVTLSGYEELRIELRGAGSAGDRVYVDDVHLIGPPPATMTPTHTPTSPPSSTPPPSATPTKTRTPTKTPTLTKTQMPTRTPKPLAIGEAEPTAVANQEAPLAPGVGMQNPGFEDVSDDGSPAAWHKFGGTMTAVEAPIRSGGRAARFESRTESTKWMYQTVQVAGGEAYSFSAWLWHDDPGVASTFLRVSWYASADGSGSALEAVDSLDALDVPAPGYRELSTGPVTAPAGAGSARLRIMLTPISVDATVIFVDDASFGRADPSAVTRADSGFAQREDGGEGAVVASSRVRARGSAPGATSEERSGRGAPRPDGARIVINEVLYDADVDGEDREGEWVELYNAGDVAASVDGWYLADNRSVDVLPAHTLEPGRFVVVAASETFVEAYPSFKGDVLYVSGGIGNGLGNDGDVLILVAPDGTFADAVSWGGEVSALNPAITDAPAGHSIERKQAGADSDTAGDFVDNERPSPGREIGAPEDAAPERSNGQSRVEVIASEGGRSIAWFLWAIMAGSSAALVGAGIWRVAPFVSRLVRSGR